MRKNYSIQSLFKTFAVTIAVMVTVLAVNPQAHAEIVYHPGGSYNLDLNGDGTTDFTFTLKYAKWGIPCPNFAASLTETPAAGNGAIVGPLRRGQEIGPNQSFSAVAAVMSWMSWTEKVVIIRHEPYCETVSHVEGGPWLGKTGYLGLTFEVNGQTYYGWAQLSCPKSGGTGTLLEYAYETIPGQAIMAGETSYAWLSSTRLNFGTVLVGTTLSKSVTLENLGPTTLTMTNSSLAGTNAADFASSNGNPPCAGSLAAGAKCVLTFTFTPSIVGKENATYSVYDDGGGSPQQLPLTGTGQ